MNEPILVTGGTGNDRPSRGAPPSWRRTRRAPCSAEDGGDPTPPALRTFSATRGAERGWTPLSPAPRRSASSRRRPEGRRCRSASRRRRPRCAAGTQHLVLISVIGADRMPIGYFRAKAEAERIVRLRRALVGPPRGAAATTSSPSLEAGPHAAGAVARRLRSSPCTAARSQRAWPTHARRTGRPGRRHGRARSARRAAARRDVQGGDGRSAAAWSPADPTAWRCGSRVPLRARTSRGEGAQRGTRTWQECLHELTARPATSATPRRTATWPGGFVNSPERVCHGSSSRHSRRVRRQ